MQHDITLFLNAIHLHSSSCNKKNDDMRYNKKFDDETFLDINK